MDRLKYIDFELKITPSEPAGTFAVHIYRSPAGEARNTFTIPFTPDRLELLTLKLARMRSATRGIDSEEMAAARELGDTLFKAVFQGQVRDTLRSSWEKAQAMSETGLRIKLRLQEAPELADLPWEFLYDADLGRFLAQSVYTPIVRYMELPESTPPLKIKLPLRILGMVSSPSDYTALDVRHEKQQLEEALAPLTEAGQIQITWLERATLDDFRRALRAEGYHVFHFIGHGGFDTGSRQGVLVLEDEQGKGTKANAERLGVLLHDQRASLRLAVLNACEGARNSRSDPFAGVAATLVKQGTPAVVAMRFEISDEGAIAFATEFYTALAQGYPVDAALAEARKAIWTLPDDVEWGTPVLYLRAADGVLFDLKKKRAKRPRELPIVGAKLEERAKPVSQEKSSLKSQAVPAEPEGAHPPVPQEELSPKSQPVPLERESPHQPAPKPESKPTEKVVLPPERKIETPLSYVLLTVLKGHDKQVNSVAISPDGQLLASGAGGMFMGTDPLRLWKMPEGRLLQTLKGHTNSVQGVAFSPDGRILASGGDDNTVRLWEMPEGKLLQTLEGHTNSVRGVAFSPDGRILASGGDDRTIRLWQLK